jgi:hypothetical protein
MSTTVPFVCPACKTVRRAKTEWIGKRVKCLTCGHESRVEAPAPEAPAPVTAVAKPARPETIHDLHLLPPAKMAHWEYQLVRHPTNDPLKLLDEMNVLGNEGWECVGPLQRGVLIYKRPRS